MRIHFFYHGEAVEPYQVVFTKRNNEVDVTCTCQLAEWSYPCDHYISILEGDEMKRVASENWNGVDTVREWLRGSHLERVYNAYKDASNNLVSAQDRFSKAKNRLACMAKAPTA
ncbi:hypothetical protein F4225_01510 [Candidatus Poribacteria bacterium]|nr:hypothetical protein [Candidatus Poribacteria bacterium]